MNELKEMPKADDASTWLCPPQNLAIENDEVDVWRAVLDLPLKRIEELQQTLATDETARAKRFRFRKDHNHFVVARALLRLILGRYLNAEPSGLRFSYNSYGKPALTDEFGAGSFKFNLSHANGLALFAVTRYREIGIDLEQIREELADKEIADQFFSPRESAALSMVPAEQRAEAFFNCWTRKEAYIKAKGEGLSLPLDQFAVSLAPGEPAALLWAEADFTELDRWSLQQLTPGAGYAAAVAVEGCFRLRCWQWSDERACG